MKKLPIKWLLVLLSALLGLTLIMSNPDFGSKNSEKATEEKIRSLCERVSGAGSVSVAVTLDGERISGVGIVCDGGENPEVVNRLLSLISASCAVPTNKIYVTYSEKDSLPQS
jgi:pentose-5-phosphate-3-epimerase